MWVSIKKKYVKIIRKNMFTAFDCHVYCTVYKTLGESTIINEITEIVSYGPNNDHESTKEFVVQYTFYTTTSQINNQLN